MQKSQDNNTTKNDTPEVITADGAQASGGEEETNPSTRSIAGKLKIFIPLLLILGVIGFVSWQYYKDARDFISTDDAYVDGDRVSVSSKILGRIALLGAIEGDTVKAGQILVRLDDTDLRAQHAQAQSALVLAQESIRLAQVNVDRAETDFKRTSVQFKETIIPKEQFDHASAELDAARARLTIAHAQVAAAKAQAGIIEAQLLNTIIVAPMTGVVAKRWLLQGDVAQPGQAIFSIYDLEHIWVTANYEETKLGGLAVGDSAEISVDSYPDCTFHGVVTEKKTFTAAQFALIPANNASGNFTKITQRVPVKLSIAQRPVSAAQPKVDLLMGMSVEVKIKVRK